MAGRRRSAACALTSRGRGPRPDGIHYRSRHDDAEDCWALYVHASVKVARVRPLDPGDEEQLKALRDVAALWGFASAARLELIPPEPLSGAYGRFFRIPAGDLP